MENLPLVTESLDGIDDKFKELYSENADGKFEFQTPDALLRAKQREKEGKKQKDEELKTLSDRLEAIEAERQAEKRALEEEKQKLDLEAAKKKGDFEAIENSYKEKMAALEESHKGNAISLQKQIQKLTVDREAQEMASRLAGKDAALLLPHIRNRLQVEIDGEKTNIRILDSDGKPTANSIADLESEIDKSEQFFPILVSSKGSGGGANGSNASGSGASGGKTINKEQLDTMSQDARRTFFRDGGRVGD